MKTHIEVTTLDRAGIALSLLCLVHCLATPLLLLTLPFLTRAFLLHPYFHIALALAVVPVGLVALLRGYRHHRHRIVLLLGLPGLVLVGLVPVVMDLMAWPGPETLLVSIGSALLVTAHWKNHRSCSCSAPHHHHRHSH